MPNRKGLLAPQNTFLDTIATRFDGTHSNFVLGNAKGRNYPIVYCSDGFCELTGYVRSMVMSKPCACEFLFGVDTSDSDKQKIAHALSLQSELKTELILYRKNGAPFWCLLDLVPIKNEKGQVVLFLVSHKDVTREKVNALEPCTDTRQKLSFAVRSVANAAQQLATDSDDDAPEAADSAANSALDSEMDSRANDSGRTPVFSADGSVSAAPDDEPDELRPNKDYLQKRRRSRAVLYHLSGQFKNKSKSKLQLNHLQNFGQKPLPEYKVQDLRTQKFIIPHYGIMRIGWDWLILFCTFYIAVIVPFNAAFDMDEDIKEGRHMPITDIIIEVMFMVDILLNFRTTFVSKSGQVVYDPRSIAFSYLKGWFLLDLAAAIPFEILFALSVETGHIQVHLLKLCRMLRLARLLQKIDRYAQYSALVLALLMAMFALLAHWLACVWYVIGKTELGNAPTNWSVGWLGELGNRMASPFAANKSGGPSVTARYVSALYFTCSSLTSVGFGNVSANTITEKIFSVCAMLLGALMHAAVFGNVTAIIQRMYARRAAYQTKSNDLKDFMRIHHVPKALKQRMQEFFQTMWSINHGIDHSEILAPFPEELRGDIALHLYRDLLSLGVFDSASQGCRKKIAYQCRYRFCTPGECLIHTGDSVASLYYISNGSIEIVRDGEVVAIMGKGDLFGSDMRRIPLLGLPAKRSAKHEQQIRQQLAMLRSQCDVRSLTYCDMQLLDVDKLVTVLLQYPDFSDKFCESLRQEISYTLDEQNSSDCPSPTATTWPLPSQASAHKSLNGYRAVPASTSPAPSSPSDSEHSENSFADDVEVDMDVECHGPNGPASKHARPRKLEVQNLSPLSLPSITEVDEVASALSADRFEEMRRMESVSVQREATTDGTNCTDDATGSVRDDAVPDDTTHEHAARPAIAASKSSDVVNTPAQSKPICSANIARSFSVDCSFNNSQRKLSVATDKLSLDWQVETCASIPLHDAVLNAAAAAPAHCDAWNLMLDNQKRIHQVYTEVRSIQCELQRLGQRFEQLVQALNRTGTTPHCSNSTLDVTELDTAPDAQTCAAAPANLQHASPVGKQDQHEASLVDCEAQSLLSAYPSPLRNAGVTPEKLRQPSSTLLYADESSLGLFGVSDSPLRTLHSVSKYASVSMAHAEDDECSHNGADENGPECTPLGQRVVISNVSVHSSTA